MIVEKVLIFILFLSPLIFFHELGHFLFARLFGVRVEVFSIGFGPKIIKWVWGNTQYAISIIPLGGYVKMFGDNPFEKDTIPENLRAEAFYHKGKWQRFWIVFGGPLANFILAFFLYFNLNLSGELVPPAFLGKISKSDKLYEYGFRPGDRLIKVNEDTITSFQDLTFIDSEISSIEVIRNNKSHNILFDPKMSQINFLELLSNSANFLTAGIFVDKDFKKYLATTKSGVALSNEFLESFVGEVYLREISNEIFELSKLRSIDDIQNMSDSSSVVNKTLNLNGDDNFIKLRREGFYSIEMQVSKLSKNLPAENAGILVGDVILSFNDQEVLSFQELQMKLQKIQMGETVKLGFLRKSKGAQSLTLSPEPIHNEDKKIYIVGIQSGIIPLSPKLVESPSKGFLESITSAVYRTYDGMMKTIEGLVKIFTNQVPLNSIGGPIAIGKVASDSFDISFSLFFRLMALVSLNLGLVNLLPVPVLDGGHIVFIFLELITGKPLSEERMRVAQSVGVSLLLFLIVFAIYNDVTRLL